MNTNMLSIIQRIPCTNGSSFPFSDPALEGRFLNKCMFTIAHNGSSVTMAKGCVSTEQNMEHKCGTSFEFQGHSAKLCCCDSPKCNDDAFAHECMLGSTTGQGTGPTEQFPFGEGTGPTELFPFGEGTGPTEPFPFGELTGTTDPSLVGEVTGTEQEHLKPTTTTKNKDTETTPTTSTTQTNSKRKITIKATKKTTTQSSTSNTERRSLLLLLLALCFYRLVSS